MQDLEVYRLQSKRELMEQFLTMAKDDSNPNNHLSAESMLKLKAKIQPV